MINTEANSSLAYNNCLGTVLDGSISATLEVVFRPTSLGTKTATIVIRSNDPIQDPFVITLSDNGNGEGGVKALVGLGDINPSTVPIEERGSSLPSSTAINWPLVAGIMGEVVVAVIIGVSPVRRKLF